MNEKSIAFIVFRPESALNAIYRPHRWAMLGDAQRPCVAIRVRNLQPSQLGFVQCDPIHQGDADPQPTQTAAIHLPLSEILLISDAPAHGQPPIGFLREG